MEQEKDHWIRNYKKVTIRMTDGSILKGKINIKEFPRLSMLLKHRLITLLHWCLKKTPIRY